MLSVAQRSKSSIRIFKNKYDSQGSLLKFGKISNCLKNSEKMMWVNLTILLKICILLLIYNKYDINKLGTFDII
jgi:hypothetical protein